MRIDISNYTGNIFYIWGNGGLFHRYEKALCSIRIRSIIDSNPDKWGTGCNKLSCISPEEIDGSTPVIIAVEDGEEIKKIAEYLDDKNIKWCHIRNLVDKLFLEKHNNCKKVTDDKLKMFIDVMVPVTSCNFKCDYCYLSQLNVINSHLATEYHDEKYIRYCLRRERIGGTAFINFCGIGETLLCDKLYPVVKELIEEGHFIQIVTNATITKKVLEYVNGDINAGHLFFKCSLHWRQLKEKNMLAIFAENVNAMRRRGISVTIELVPEDSIITDISEIKGYCIENFGALPHVTVTRDERYDDNRIYTKLTEREYEKIWGNFDSSMFNFKMKNRSKPGECYAGLWAGELNLATGDLYKCTNNPWLCNIYENPDDDIPFEKVGIKCALPYCFNNHAYITLGLIPAVKAPTYLEMRDRSTNDGRNWIVGEIRDIFTQNLCDNNMFSEEK